MHMNGDYMQWCIAKNGGGYTQRGVAKGLKVPCLFMITEVSIRCQKTPKVGIRRVPAYTPPQYTTDYVHFSRVQDFPKFSHYEIYKTSVNT